MHYTLYAHSTAHGPHGACIGERNSLLGWCGLLLLLLGLAGCQEPPAPYRRAQGTAIGTFYSIIYQDSAGRDLQAPLDSLFRHFEHHFSLFDTSTPLSRFNASAWGIADSALASLTLEAQHWTRITDGAFDPSAAPLVEIWGYAQRQISQRPSDSLVVQTLGHVGMQRLRVEGDSVLKLDSCVRLNFNAIAKGLLVDRSGQLLRRLGVRNYLVEIGGEIKAEGVNPRGELWRVGIEAPDSLQLPGAQILAAISLPSGAGMATSGNYRQARTLDGMRWSHIVDPRSGQPANTDVLSATVIAPTTTQADALATAMVVLGMEGAKSLTARLDSIRTILIFAHASDQYAIWDSQADAAQ